MLTKASKSSSTKSTNTSAKKSTVKNIVKKNATSNLRNEVIAFRKDRILMAACDAFYEHGYHDCTVDMIAKQLSGTKAIVYYYFPEKHSILYGIYCRALGEAQTLIKAAAAKNEHPSDKLAAIARSYAQWVIDNNRLVGVYWREIQSLTNEARAAVFAEQKVIDDIVAQVIRDGVSQECFHVSDVQTTARAINGMITFTYTWWRGDKRLTRDDTAEHYAQMALRLAGAC
jgi:AcrR family transcriptional regulator